MTNKERALLVADKAHANQTYDIYPYGYHIRQVVKIAEDLGYDESIVVASVLHDTLEDTGLSYNDLKKAFGEEVAEIVYCVTDELGRDRKERKEKTYPKIRSNWKATVVKICDRIANMQQSKNYNKSLFKMYQKEHDDFCRNLMCKEHPHSETNKAWHKLNQLVSEM
jgi:(p)ppGpp synthase/HD superfamily hydrolase